MTNPGPAITGSYDYRLVALSVVLAIFASYTGLDLAGRVASGKGWIRTAWLMAGALAMGLGIWAMHYVGMLAMSLQIPVFYHLKTVVVSFLPAPLASAAALFVTSRSRRNLGLELIGSVTMGGGIAATHYIGMAAMRCAAVAVYDWRIVAFSIGLAIVIADVALRIGFLAREAGSNPLRKVTSAVAMGSAIPLLHYTGMWAATFRACSNPPDLSGAVAVSSLGLVSVAGTSFIVMNSAIALSFLDRFTASQKMMFTVKQERELYFQKMAEAVPELIWTAGPDGSADFLNGRWQEYTGLSAEESEGGGWARAIHPDDLRETEENWHRSLRTGDPFDLEQRLLGSDGKYRWFLARANPIRNAAGEIVKWCGMCINIENQKMNEQILEEQVLERTMQLADVNERLQMEISEKDFARRQLDEEQEKMMKDLEQRSERATKLARMGEMLQSSVSKEEVIAVSLSFAPKIFPFSRGAIMLLNSSRNLAEINGSWSECELPSMEFDPADCWALRTGQPHLVIAGDTTVRCTHVGDLTRTHLCVPILAQGETLGLLHFQAKGDLSVLEALELTFRSSFAGQIGLSIANIRLRDALRSQSTRDPLTGLYNRRYLEETLNRELRRAARAKQNLGVMLIDLDHFKNFNDAFGHDAGDAVLREAGLCLAKGIRAEDVVCRYGGEEFVIVMPTANAEAIRARAERLRQKMRGMTVVHEGKSMGMITISVGAAVFPQHGTTAQQLIAAADGALYEAKRNGRDQVVTANVNESAEKSGSQELAAAGG